MRSGAGFPPPRATQTREHALRERGRCWTSTTVVDERSASTHCAPNSLDTDDARAGREDGARTRRLPRGAAERRRVHAQSQREQGDENLASEEREEGSRELNVSRPEQGQAKSLAVEGRANRRCCGRDRRRRLHARHCRPLLHAQAPAAAGCPPSPAHHHAQAASTPAPAEHTTPAGQTGKGLAAKQGPRRAGAGALHAR